MPVESAADRLVFVNEDEHGVAASYNPNTGSTVPVSGIFDDGDDVSFAEPGLSSGQPTFRMREADLPAGAEVEIPSAPDVLTISALAEHPRAGRAYAVRQIKRDGTGFVTLVLEENS